MVQAFAAPVIQTPGDLGVNADDFARHLKSSNLSPRTVQTYTEAVSRLAAFLVSKGMPTDLAGIHREHVEAFIVHLLETPGRDGTPKPATAANRYRSLQQFFRWAVDQGEITASPMARMRAPKIPETPAPILPDDGIARLLAGASGRTFADLRDRALLRCLIATGARVSEIAGLRWSPDDSENNDVGLRDNPILRLYGKGRRWRIVPLDAGTELAVRRYTRARADHRHAALPNLWLGAKGPFTVSGIEQMVQSRGAAAGMGDRVHPHLFRHAFAHYQKANGMSEEDIMQLGGWRDATTLRRYGAQLSAERAINAGRKQNPGDRFR